MCLLYPVKLSKACISHQERNVASRIKKLLMPLLYQYCYNLKAAKIRTVKLLRKLQNHTAGMQAMVGMNACHVPQALLSILQGQ